MASGSKYKVVHISEVEALKVGEEGAEKAWVRWLISKDDGAPNFSMRFFEVDTGGRPPIHSHPWEHEVFILEGRCKLIAGEDERIIGSGYAVYIPPDLKHGFINVGNGKLRFICLIPHK